MSKIQYFSQCKTKQEAKTTFRALAKKFHPDANRETDTTEIMKQIISEYETIYKKLPSEKSDNSAYDNMTDEQFSAYITQEMQEIISNISHLPITLEIIGTWLWISGDTMKYKAYLTANNCLWSPEKKMYYWRLERNKFYRKGKKGKDIEDIRDTYGSQKVHNTHRAAIGL